ncbi:UNVERIFIED_CONTAM: hypothetical protein FKN15_020282 [Acipenser sinensis]
MAGPWDPRRGGCCQALRLQVTRLAAVPAEPDPRARALAATGVKRLHKDDDFGEPGMAVLHSDMQLKWCILFARQFFQFFENYKFLFKNFSASERIPVQFGEYLAKPPPENVCQHMSTGKESDNSGQKYLMLCYKY